MNYLYVSDTANKFYVPFSPMFYEPLFLDFMFVFNPRWDMHSLRTKEIKDSPNSQAVPKLLVLLKNDTVWFHTGSG